MYYLCLPTLLRYYFSAFLYMTSYINDSDKNNDIWNNTNNSDDNYNNNSDHTSRTTPMRSPTSSDATSMQMKIRSMQARLAQTRMDNAIVHEHGPGHTSASLPPRARRIGSGAPAPASAAAASSALERELKEKEREKERKQKMQALRTATLQRVHARQHEAEEQDRRRAEKEAAEAEQQRKARKEELARLKERRERQLKAAKSDNGGDTDPQVSAARLKLAKAHYRKQLLINLGLSPWMQLVNAHRLNVDKAENFYADGLMQRYYGIWKNVLINSRLERRKISDRMNMLAVSYYRRQLMRFVWKKWKLYRKLLKAKALAIGGQFSRHALRRRGFLSWKIAYDRRVRSLAMKMQTIAIPHCRVVLRRYYISRWKDFVRQAKFERDVQLRTDLTWSKVQGWLVTNSSSDYKK